MKKILLFASLIIATSIFFSCSKTKTAQELMKEEKKAIERFIVKNDIEETTDTAKMYNDQTGKVYFKTKEGLYVHVFYIGNKTKAEYNTEVMVRYKDAIFFKTDTTKYTNISSYSNPDIFYYGNTYSGLACDGWAIGLNYASDEGEVSLIIPSSLQPYSYQSSYEPMYYGYLKYRFK